MARARFHFLSRFLDLETASGLPLLAGAGAALLWANGPWAGTYLPFWQRPRGLPLIEVINTGLMTLFFLLAGLEIRHELRTGALSSLKLAALPALAALGGVLCPAILYVLTVRQGPLLAGWAIPTATDVAFALGALALLGRRIAPALRVLLLALAILDDIAAILIIACAYHGRFELRGLLLALGGILLILVLRRRSLPWALTHALPGLLVWAGLWDAGIQPTLAGVVVGLLTADKPGQRASAARVQASLHPWVAYLIMPLFALANAGLALSGLPSGLWSLTLSPLPGICLGLVLGKPLGIAGAATLGVRLGWCVQPPGVGTRELLLLGCFGGIGFTMALFLATLSLHDGAALAAAKLAILLGSLCAAAAGLVLGWRLPTRPDAFTAAADPR